MLTLLAADSLADLTHLLSHRSVHAPMLCPLHSSSFALSLNKSPCSQLWNANNPVQPFSIMTLSSLNPWIQACRVHSVSVYGICDQLGMEGKAHTTGQQGQLYNPEGEFFGKPLKLALQKMFVWCLLSSLWRPLSA